MHAALDVNIPNYASAIVGAEEVVASIFAHQIETSSALPRPILAAKAALVQQGCPSKGGPSFFAKLRKSVHENCECLLG